jgi:hypothetical protein
MRLWPCSSVATLSALSLQRCRPSFKRLPGPSAGSRRRQGLRLGLVADEGRQHFVAAFGGIKNDAAELAALAIDMPGRGIDHDVGTELERALQQGAPR